MTDLEGHHPGPAPTGPMPPDDYFRQVEAWYRYGADIITLKPRRSIVAIEFVVVGYDVVLIDRAGKRIVLDDHPGVVEDAINSAIWHAREHDCEFVPGAVRWWFAHDGDAA